MKSNNKILLCIILIVFTFISSCEEEIDLDLKNTSPKLVVEGNVLLGLDSLIEWQKIKLTLSANYTGNTFPSPVSNANVKVIEGSNSYNFIYEGEGIYKSNFIAEINKTYKLVIEYNGNTYEAQETIKNGPVMSDLTINFFPSALGSPSGNFVTINTLDPVDERNFYLWKLFINNQLMINPSPGNIYRAIQKDDFFNGSPLANYLPYDNFPVVTGNQVRMEQLNISEEMYNYYYAVFNLSATSPISGDVPSGNIKGNVINISSPDNEALGYFGACSISIKDKNI